MNPTTINKLLGKNSGYNFLPDAPIPKVDEIKIINSKDKCKICNSFGKTYACPPFTSDEEYSKINEYNKASILMKEYDIPDEKSADLEINVFQNLCRMIKKEYMKLGLDVLPITYGACSHCEVCNCTKNVPCGAPDSRVYSLCGCGIDYKEYAKTVGIDLENKTNKLTLYGLFLTKD